MLRRPGHLFAALRFLRLAIPLRRSRGSFPCRPAASPTCSQDCFYPGSPIRSPVEMEWPGPPRFLGNPFVHVPRSVTPVRSRRQVDTATGCCLPSLRICRPSRSNNIGVQWRGPRTRCLHFTCRGCPDRRKTRYQPMTNLSWAGLEPAGFQY